MFAKRCLFFAQIDNLGSIVDLRNKETCPSFRNLYRKDASELKQLCAEVCFAFATLFGVYFSS